MESVAVEAPYLHAITQPKGIIARLLTAKMRFDASEEALNQGSVSRASAILSIHPQRPDTIRRLIIQQPDASPAEARLLILALALVGLANKFNQAEGLARVEGPLLFVTQQIARCRELLESIKIDSVTITDVYPALSLPKVDEAGIEQAIYIANPGRVCAAAPHQRFGAVVIDATHPRTFGHRDTLLACPTIAAAPLQVVLQPVLDLRTSVSGAGQVHYWLWDPLTMEGTSRALAESASRYQVSERHYWIAHQPIVETALLEVHDLLAQAMALVSREPPPKLLLAWGLYHRLRELSVPLELAERAWRRGRFATTIRDQIEGFSRLSWEGSSALNSFLAVHGQRIMTLLTKIDEEFVQGNEPSKFYALAQVLETLLNETDRRFLRVVTPSEEEARVLSELFSDLVDGVPEAIRNGTVEFVHQREEARRVAEGHTRETLLVGARMSRYRYLDLFPSERVHLVCYGYEADVDQHALSATFQQLRHFSHDEYRQRTLGELGFPTAQGEVAEASQPHLKAPPVKVHGELKHTLTRVSHIQTAPFVFEWSSLRHSGGQDLLGLGRAVQLSIEQSGIVRVLDSENDEYRFSETEHVDVYYSETGDIRRVDAVDLRVNDHLILLLDDRYAALFERLREAIDEHRPPMETLLLERWRAAKHKVLGLYDSNRTKIYSNLAEALTVDYSALVRWFADDEDGSGTLGPQQFKDFVVIALLSGVYHDDADLLRTFNAITAERTNRRQLGRRLRLALKALVGGASYDQAIKAAAALNTPLDDVFNAIDVREIIRVDRINANEVRA